jgi:hypothetical protein
VDARPRPVAEFLSTRFARPYRMVPVEIRRDEGRAQIAGYYMRGDGAAASAFGYF